MQGRLQNLAEILGRTGVEMEALTAVQVGLLTVYDMVKASDRGAPPPTCDAAKHVSL